VPGRADLCHKVPTMKPIDQLVTKIDPLFKAPAFDASAIPAGLALHPEHRQLLEKRNGGYFYGGALHVFGACTEPAFHSLTGWNAADGWRTDFGQAAEGLFFFAETAFGDQFALDAAGKVFALRSEEGVVEAVADDFEHWLLKVVADPDGELARDYFVGWVQSHGHLPYGSQLQAFPPFVLLGDEEEPDIQAVDSFDNMAFHGAFALQFAEALANVPDGHRLKVDVTEDGIAFSTVEGEGEPAA
jgi:hypothetical protein